MDAVQGLSQQPSARSFSNMKKRHPIDNKSSPKINFLNIQESQDSKYDGKPLLEPKIPYQFEVKVFKSDPKKSMIQNAYSRVVFMTFSSIEYSKDILFWRVDPFCFKTAEFTKRNFNRFRDGFGHLVYELKKVKRGFTNLKNDVRKALGIQTKNLNLKYNKVNYVETQKVRQVKIDVIKFIPFSFFILIPGAEILLPPFLMVFPNSVPSQFLSKEARAEKFAEIKEKRTKAGKELKQRIPVYLNRLEKDDQILKADIPKVKKLVLDLKRSDLLPTDLLQYKEIFKLYADFKYLKVDTLYRAASFMSLNPVTGLNIINNVLKIVKLNIPIDTPVLSVMTKLLLVRELNMYFCRIRKEDESLSFDCLDSMPEEQIDRICFRRGIEIDKQTLKEKKEDLKLWLSISNQRNVPNSLLLFSRITDFTNDLFRIDEDEDDQEVLRRSPEDTYYLEKMRVFEETFGIDKLQSMVTKMSDKLDDQENYDPTNQKFLYSDSDLQKTMILLDEFETRHRAIKASINETYRIGNRLLDYLEKQIIIDHHLRGEQEKLLLSFPHLKKKAQTFLGFEMFFELSVQPDGIPMSSSDPFFNKLIQKQKDIQKAIENEFKVHDDHRKSNPNLPKYSPEDDPEKLQEQKHKEYMSSQSDDEANDSSEETEHADKPQEKQNTQQV